MKCCYFIYQIRDLCVCNVCIKIITVVNMTTIQIKNEDSNRNFMEIKIKFYATDQRMGY